MEGATKKSFRRHRKINRSFLHFRIFDTENRFDFFYGLLLYIRREGIINLVSRVTSVIVYVFCNLVTRVS